MKTLLLLLLTTAACHAQTVASSDTTNHAVYYQPRTVHHYRTTLPDLRKEKLPRIGDVYHLSDGSAYEFCKDLLIGRSLEVVEVLYYWKSLGYGETKRLDN